MWIVNKSTCLVLVLLICGLASSQITPWPYLPQGPNKVGFKTMQVKGKQGDNLSVCIWYPAGTGGAKMRLKDYIIDGRETPGMSDSAAVADFKHVIELPFLFHLDKIPEAEFAQVVSTPFFSFKDAVTQKGKFPLVIAYAGAVGYPETFEYFASHGFVVACVTGRLPDINNDTLLYVHATDILEEFMHLMMKQPYVDTSRIAAFGHGWGIQPSFYLVMRSPLIKLLVNLDGAVFGPRSKTTLSPDYKPTKLTVPMLNILSGETVGQEDAAQFNVLQNGRYKVMVDEAVSHHDFSEYGRVVDGGLHKRGSAAPLVEKTIVAAHVVMLYFLSHGKLDENLIDPGIFKVDFVNAK